VRCGRPAWAPILFAVSAVPRPHRLYVLVADRLPQVAEVLSLLVTAGQRGDAPQFQPVPGKISVPRLGVGRPRKRPEKVRADKAYSSRAYLRRRGIACTIPPKADQIRHRKNKGRLGGCLPVFCPAD